MLSGRQLNLDDYWAILRRRKWLIVIPIILGPVFAILIARKLPPKYTSTSLVLIEEPKVPTSFVPSLLGNDLTSRLAHLEEQVLSRSNLQPMIQQFGLYKKDWNRVSMDELVTRIQGAVMITPAAYFKNPTEGGGERNQVPGFKIQFTADTPELAQEVCTQITSMLVDANLRFSESRAQGTANFIGEQLQGAKAKLQEQDAKLAAFQRQYFGSLPDQEQSTVRLLGTLSAQLDSLTDTLNRDEENKTYLESLLAQELGAWKAAQGKNNPQTLQEQLAHMEDQLAALRLQYTDTYPDVIRAKEAIAELKQKIAHQSPGTLTTTTKATGYSPNASTEPPQITQLRAQLHGLDLAIAIAQRHQEQVRREFESYQQKLRMTPAVEQEYKDITRNYKTALSFYNSLLAKEDESQMSTSLERQSGGQQFQVLDPADLPQKPSFPNYERFAGGGLLVGVVVGLGIALLLEMRDKALRDERDIEFFLGVPALALIPSVETGRERLKSGSSGREPAEEP